MYLDAVMKEVKIGMKEVGTRVLEEKGECRLPDLLYAEDLVLCGESEEDPKVMVGLLLLNGEE